MKSSELAVASDACSSQIVMAAADFLISGWARDSLIESEDDGCGNADGGHECVGASVVAGVDAAPVLEFPEHVLDPVSLAIEHCTVGDRDLAVDL